MSKPPGREKVVPSGTTRRLAVAVAIVVLARGLRADPSIPLTFGPFDDANGNIIVTAKVPSTPLARRRPVKATITAVPAGSEFQPSVEVPYKVKDGQLTFAIPFHRSNRLIQFTVVATVENADGALTLFEGKDSLEAAPNVIEPTTTVTPSKGHPFEAHFKIERVTRSGFRLVGSIRPRQGFAPIERTVRVIVQQKSGDAVRTDLLKITGSEPFRFDLPLARLGSNAVDVDVALAVIGAPDAANPKPVLLRLAAIPPSQRPSMLSAPRAVLIFALVLAILVLFSRPKLKPDGEKRRPGPVQEVSWRYSAFGPSRVILEVHDLAPHIDDVLWVAGARHPLSESRSVSFEVASKSRIWRTKTDLKITLHSSTTGKAQIKVVARVFQALRRYSVRDSVDVEFALVPEAAPESPEAKPLPPGLAGMPIGKVEQTPTSDDAGLGTATFDVPLPSPRAPSPPQSDVERNLLEAVNGWLRDEGMSRADLMQAVKSRGLTASFYSMADIGRTVTDPRGRYRFREDPANGAWLWQPLDSGVDFLAVPADDTPFVTLDVVTLLASLYEGVPLNRGRVAFAAIMRACRVRAEGEGEYVVTDVGSLRVHSAGAPVSDVAQASEVARSTDKHHDEPTGQDRIGVVLRAAQESWDQTRGNLETTIGRQGEELKKLRDENTGLRDENTSLKSQIQQLQAEKRDIADVQTVRQEGEALKKERESLAVSEGACKTKSEQLDRDRIAMETEFSEREGKFDRDRQAFARVLEIAVEDLAKERSSAQKKPTVQRVFAKGVPRDVQAASGTSADSQPKVSMRTEASGPASLSGAIAPVTDTGLFSWLAPEQLNAWIDAIAVAFPEVGPDARFVPKQHLESLLKLEEIVRKENRSSDLEITLAHVIGVTGSPPCYDVRLLPASPPDREPPHTRLGGVQEGLWIQVFVAARTRTVPDGVLIFAPPGAYDAVSFASYSNLIANFPPSGRVLITRLESPARLQLDAKSNRYRVVAKMKVSFA